MKHLGEIESESHGTRSTCPCGFASAWGTMREAADALSKHYATTRSPGPRCTDCDRVMDPACVAPVTCGDCRNLRNAKSPSASPVRLDDAGETR